MNLASAFAASVRQNPKKPAVFWGENEIAYETLAWQSAWVARHLTSERGVGRGDRVAIWMKNCPQFIPSLFGAFGAGAVAVPVNTFLKASEVAYLLRDSGARTLIADHALADGALEMFKKEVPELQVIFTEAIPDAPGELEAPAAWGSLSEMDLAVIIYTSGTTGRPKGAMLSHGNLLHNVDSCRQVLRAADGDRFALLLPMFHSFMLCVCVFLPLLVGGSIVLIKSLHPAKNILMEIMHRQATLLPGIPQFFRTLAQAPLPPNLPLRLCISGAAPMPVEVHNQFTAKVPVPLLEGYGLSEASPVVTMNPLDGASKPGSIGKPLPDVEVSVQDERGRMLPAGEVGEICVRGGNVMQGYWNQPEETAKTLRDGWLYTGDVGYADSEGYYYITDRKKDMLLVNGINVYPREIEEVLYQFPDVKEAAVIGRADPRKGEQPVAYVAPNDGVTLEEKAVLQFLRERLADYKIPRRVHFVEALPRTATGKVLKTELRKMQAESGASSADV